MESVTSLLRRPQRPTLTTGKNLEKFTLKPTNVQKCDLDGLEAKQKIRLVNSLSGYKPANLIGTINKNGIHNVAIFSSVFHLGTNPAMLGFIMRPPVVRRDTYENILHSGFFTVNHVTADIAEQAHQSSAPYPSEVSEFDELGLTPVIREACPAPFVSESPVQICCELASDTEIPLNGTRMIVGHIRSVYLDEGLMDEYGDLDLAKAGVAVISGLNHYSNANKLYSFDQV